MAKPFNRFSDAARALLAVESLAIGCCAAK